MTALSTERLHVSITKSHLSAPATEYRPDIHATHTDPLTDPVWALKVPAGPRVDDKKDR